MKLDVQRAVVAVIFILGMIQFPLLGQVGGSLGDFSELVRQAYGQDQELVNGMQYYNRHSRSLGSPYLMDGPVHQGSVTIRGHLYTPVWLRFDIHSQLVEVEYQTMNGADDQVILVCDRLDEFTIGSSLFRKLRLEENEEFFQVIGDERVICYIRWEKKLVPVSGDSRFIEEFTDAKRSYILQLDGNLADFHNKGSFVKLFPDTLQKQVKRLIRSSKLSLRTASPEQLELLMLAASNLLNGGGNP